MCPIAINWKYKVPRCPILPLRFFFNYCFFKPSTDGDMSLLKRQRSTPAERKGFSAKHPRYTNFQLTLCFQLPTIMTRLTHADSCRGTAFSVFAQIIQNKCFPRKYTAADYDYIALLEKNCPNK